MEPLLHVGDVALIHADDHPEPGEVVLVDRSGELPLLHRLVRWNSDGTATTQGDANPEPDSTPVGPKEIRGVGRVALPAIGMPSVWVAHRQVGAIVGAALAELLLTVAAARGALRHHGQRAERSGLPGIVPLDDRTLRELRAAAAGRAVPRDLATRLR
jgi:signal peptidase